MNCFKCGSSDRFKSGFYSGKQRYKCKGCGYQYTRDTPMGMDEEVKRQAVSLYLEGMGIRAIGRQLGVSHVAVLKWLRVTADKLVKVPLPKQAEAIELDEVWHYEQKKRGSYGCG